MSEKEENELIKNDGTAADAENADSSPDANSAPEAEDAREASPAADAGTVAFRSGSDRTAVDSNGAAATAVTAAYAGVTRAIIDNQFVAG